jgi:hypothetical protein
MTRPQKADAPARLNVRWQYQRPVSNWSRIVAADGKERRVLGHDHERHGGVAGEADRG